MRKYVLAFAVLVSVLPVAGSASFFEDGAAAGCVNGAGAFFETVFTSSAALSPAIAKELGSAKKSIRIAARQFISKPVAESLISVMRTGVDLKMVLNKKTNSNPYSAAQLMATLGAVPNLTKSDDGLYAEYVIVDDRDIILGNIAGFADEEDEKKNAASVLIIRNAPELAKQYLANWQIIWEASEKMKLDK